MQHIRSAQLFATGGIDGFATFHDNLTGQEAVSPLEKRNAASYVLPFDDTGALSTGLAMANVASTAAAIPVIIRDDTGAVIDNETVNLAGYGHTAFMLSSQYASVKGKRGTVEFDTPNGAQISVLGLRAAPILNTSSFAITTLPVLANVAPGKGSMAQVAAGGGWETIVALVNVGATAADATLSFFDNTGAPWSMPLNFPQTGTTVTESSVNQTIQPGATLLISASAGSAQSTGGSAQLSTTGQIGAFTLFRDNLTGQEAGVPLEIRNASGYLLAFDNTGGISTGVAVANISSQAASIPVTLRDDAGNR